MIKLNDQYSLTQFKYTDADKLVEHLNHKSIYDATLKIPYPYQEDDAFSWIISCRKRTDAFAIRTNDGALIGCIALNINKGGIAELGYWLAVDFQHKGIMTMAVKAFSNYVFEKCGVTKLEASTFVSNESSQKVLIKAGFVREGVLRNHFYKGGKFIDAMLFGKVNE